MTRALAFTVLLASVAGAIGCGASTIHAGALDELERVRAAPAAKESASQAPEVYAHAEQERDYARTAQANGDEVGATLHAERAIAAYGRALAVGRLARAISALAESQKGLDDATAEEQSFATSRAKLDLDAEELERRAQFARDRLAPAVSGEASPEREAARWAAARSVAFEATLLCQAARLVSADGPGLVDAQAALDRLDARVGRGPGPATRQDPTEGPLIDDAGAARAQCLDVLTRARRGNRADGDGADALLAELSVAGGWNPTRDERGVVITIRGAFSGTKLTDDAKAKFESLGRVAAAHASFGLQVVVHDAQSPLPNDDTDAARVIAVTQALIAGGAAGGHLKGEKAGARAPVVDPNDARLRARNERVDVVFVSRG